MGWEGFYDLEIFSDNGAFGNAYPDSLWDLDAAELARRGREAFTQCWLNRRVTAAAVDQRGEHMRVSKRARWALVIVAALALVLAATAAARTRSAAGKKPIVIGWAYDGQSGGPMNPFDAPALAAAKIEIAKVNKKGVDGRKIVLKTCNTQGDNAADSSACAAKLISEGVNIMFTTCDVDLAAPVVQPAINKGLLTIAPCIGTDQMGPKRFGSKGKLAFSFGNVAQDEGSAMAQVAWNHGWKTADLATDTVIVYFKAVVTAFKARFKQLGGKINYETTYQDSAVRRQQRRERRDRDQRASGEGRRHRHRGRVRLARSVHHRACGRRATTTPVLNSWAGDGTYWVGGLNPKVTNYWYVTYANAFGHDPNPAVNKLASQIKAATGGFVTGPAAIDGVVTAIKRAHGSLVGSKLAAVMQKFHNVPTISGKVSFSKKLHSVFGRAVPRDRDQQQRADREGLDPRQEGPEQPGFVGLGDGTQQQTGEARRHRSGPPPSPVRSRASRRCGTSRSSCARARWSG